MTSPMRLDVLLTLHQKRCKRCREGRRCEAGWRNFNDTAQIIMREYDPNRAKA